MNQISSRTVTFSSLLPLRQLSDEGGFAEKLIDEIQKKVYDKNV